MMGFEVFELTAYEVAARDEDAVYEFMKRPEFRLAVMNSRVRDKMLDAMIEELGLGGGWYYCFCLPGCLPDSDAHGPYETRAAAHAAATEEMEEEDA